MSYKKIRTPTSRQGSYYSCLCSFFISTRLFFHQVACNLYIISRKTAYHQLEELHIIKPKRIVFMHGRAVMIYRRKRPMIYKDVPSLMICQTTLRFGLDKKILDKNVENFLERMMGVGPRRNTTICQPLLSQRLDLIVGCSFPRKI